MVHNIVIGNCVYRDVFIQKKREFIFSQDKLNINEHNQHEILHCVAAAADDDPNTFLIIR